MKNKKLVKRWFVSNEGADSLIYLDITEPDAYSAYEDCDEYRSFERAKCELLQRLRMVRDRYNQQIAHIVSRTAKKIEQGDL